MSYMKDPRPVLARYLQEHGEGQTWKGGRESVGLSIVQLIKDLESFPVASEGEKQGVISCLHTLLIEQDLVHCYELYDTLYEWAKTTVVREPLLPGTAYVSEQRHVGQPSKPSAPEAPSPMPSQRPMPDGWRPRGQSPGWDDVSRHERVARLFAEAQRKQSE